MSELIEEKVEEMVDGFWDDVSWNLIRYNAIASKGEFLKLRAKYPRLFGSFLEPENHLAFYMFKPLDWETYKEIRTQELDKYEQHEAILTGCLVWPVLNEKTMPDAGTMLTLVYQILAQSSFLKDPSQALKMIVEI